MAIIKKIASEDYVNQYAQPKGNYLTEHQDLSNYAKKDHAHSQYLTEHQDLSEYAKKLFMVALILEGNIYSINSTYYEILDAISDGCVVVLVAGNAIIYLDMIVEDSNSLDDMIRFSYCYTADRIIHFDILPDNTVRYSEEVLDISQKIVVPDKGKTLANVLDELYVAKEELNQDIEAILEMNNIDYASLLAFNTNELVFDINTSSVLGQAILGQLVLA